MNRRTFLRTGATGLGLSMLGGCVTATAKRESAGQNGGAARIATFSCDVTPPLGTPIYSSMKPLAVVETPLLAKGVILEDQGQRYVLCAVDYCEILNGAHLLYRQKIAEAAGTSAERVVVQCVHQHTAPMADGDASRILAGLPNPDSYPSAASFEEPAERVAQAVREAAEKMQPYDRIGTGQAKVERVASNRRVPLENGTIGVRYSSCRDPKLVEMPEGLIDPLLKTVTFGFGDQPIARLHYYATHPQSFYGDPRASYDFVGMAREKRQNDEKVFQVYFTGCAGDVTCGKYNVGSPESRQGLMERLSAGMEGAVKATQYTPVSQVAWQTISLRLPARNDAGFQAGDAQAALHAEKSSILGRYGAAMEIAWHNRADVPIEVASLRMGGLSMVFLPGEPMVAYQLFAQECRPNAFVCVAGYGDGAPGYVCLEKAYAEGGYEPTASNLAPQAEGLFREAIQQLLR